MKSREISFYFTNLYGVGGGGGERGNSIPQILWRMELSIGGGGGGKGVIQSHKFYDGWNYLFILGLKINHVSLGGSCASFCTWWRHQMETFSALLSLCAGNSSITGEFPSQRPAARSFEYFFDLSLDKQFRCRWFEAPLHLLWVHCNDDKIIYRLETHAYDGINSSLMQS